MTKTSRMARVAILPTLAACALVFAGHRLTVAADHLDPPTRTDPAVDEPADRAADIADIYAFHTEDDLVLALTFAGPHEADAPPTYDRDVLYSINISNAGERTDPEFRIRIRFGFDGGGNAGVQVTGLPPQAGGGLAGPVETNLERNGVLVRAGLFDDPFFFDLQGFRDTRSSGDLMFDSSRDFFAGRNDTAVVIQMPRAFVENGDHVIDIWTTTARIEGGQG